jgi:thiamine transport system ATP-binding protein
MLDEPLGALDRALRDELARELHHVFDRLGVAVLLVTHDHDEAFALGDRVAVMHDGRVEQIGTPAEVWRRPATEFVARFLGWNVTDALGTGRAAVRPDALRIAPDGPLTGTVVERSFHRDHFLVRIALSGHNTTLDVAIHDGEPPVIGEAVRLAVDADGLVRLSS